MGMTISGEPTVVIEAYNDGLKSFTNRDFHTALSHLNAAISAIEASQQHTSIIQVAYFGVYSHV